MSEQKNDAFIHLHVHSVYSLLDGACRIPEMMERLKELGQTAVALTDHGNLYAAIWFYQEQHLTESGIILFCCVKTRQAIRIW